MHGQVFSDRTQYGDRHEHQQPEDDDNGPQREAEVALSARSDPLGFRSGGLGREESGERERRDDRDVREATSPGRSEMFQNGVLSPSPSNPDPLLAAAELNS